MANQVKRGRKRSQRGVPTALVIILLVIALVMGGLGGFAIARQTNPYRAELMAANARIMELENTMQLSGFSIDNGSWNDGGSLASDLAGAPESDGDDLWDDGDIWDEDGLLAGTLSEDGEPVVVAEFDGGELLSTEVIPEYNDQLTNQILSGYSAEDVGDSLLNSVLSTLAGEKIVAQKARELGLDKLTDEDLSAIEAQASAIYADQLGYYAAFVAQPGMTEEQVNAAAAQESGITLESITEDLKADWPSKKFFDYTVKDVTVSDGEIQQYYKDTLAEQKSEFAQYPEMYEYAHMDGELILYNPAGYRAVRDLLLPFESESDAAKAAELLDQVAQLDPTLNQAEIQKLQDELDPLFASLETRAQEVVKKLQDGATFDDLLQEYGRDEGMQAEPVRSQGYYITDTSYLFSSEFVEGSMLLEQPGDVSAPLRSSAGVHLTQYVGDVPFGDVSLDSVYDQVKAAALEKKQSDYYEQTTAAMLDAANVKYYPERLQ